MAGSKYTVDTGDGEDVIAAGPGSENGEVPDPYDVLGVTDDASDELVRQAARARKKETHPDQGGDGDEYKRVVRAEEQLLDRGDG